MAMTTYSISVKEISPNERPGSKKFMAETYS